MIQFLLTQIAKLKKAVSNQESRLGNVHFAQAWNATTITVDIGFTATIGQQATGILFSGNQGELALISFDTEPKVTKINGSRGLSISVSGSVYTITADATLWGLTTIIWDSN